MLSAREFAKKAFSRGWSGKGPDRTPSIPSLPQKTIHSAERPFRLFPRTGILLAPVLILSTLSLSGCGGTSAATSKPLNGAHGPLPVVTIAGPSNGESGYELAYIKAEHLDTKYGVDLKPIYTSIPNCQIAPLTGMAEVSGALAPPAVIANNTSQTKHATLTIFAPSLWSALAIVVGKNATGTTLGAYKGDNFGGQPTSGGAYLFAEIYAAKQGLNLQKAFHYVETSPPALIALMERGSTPISLDFQPWTAELLYTGKYKTLVNFDTYFQQTVGTKALKTGVGSTVTWAQAHPKEVVAIRDAYIAAAKAIAAGKDDAFFASNAQRFFGIKTTGLANYAHKQMLGDFAAQWGQSLWTPQISLLGAAQKLGLVPPNADLNVFWQK